MATLLKQLHACEHKSAYKGIKHIMFQIWKTHEMLPTVYNIVFAYRGLIKTASCLLDAQTLTRVD